MLQTITGANTEQTDLAYIAGIVDGEGCICIIKLRSGNFSLRFSVKMVNPSAINLIKEKFAGSVYPVACVPPRRPKYDWKVCTKDAAIILGCLLPFLRVKKDQAIVALSFAETFGTKTNKIDLLKREVLYLKMKKLNQVGC